MKYCLFFITALAISKIGVCQFPLTGETVTKVDTGFIYYWRESSAAFVPVKHYKQILRYEDFSTDNLKIGIRIALYGFHYTFLGIDTSATKYKLFSSGADTFYLKIIPVEIKYTIFKYAFRKDQLKRHIHIEKFKLPGKHVSITTVGGLSIQIANIKPLARG